MQRLASALLVTILLVLASALAVEATASISALIPPTLVSIKVSPLHIDTSAESQVITITAHITDNLSGCPTDSECLRIYFFPLIGPE